MTEPQVLSLATSREQGAGRLREVIARTARAMAWPVRSGPPHVLGGTDFAEFLDERMLSDIGLDTDAIRREPPRLLWPH